MNEGSLHCVKSVQIRSFFWSVFSCIWTEYGDLLRKSPYSERIQENTDQIKFRIWTLLTQCDACHWNLSIFCLHCVNFGGHQYCGSERLIFLFCHLILWDQFIKGSCDFMSRSPPRLVTTLPRLVAIGIVIVGLETIWIVTWSHKTALSMSYVTLWVGVSQGKSSTC